MRYLLDANVIVDFQNSESTHSNSKHLGLLDELVKASHLVDMAVAEKVFDELTLPKPPKDSSDLVGKKRKAAEKLAEARLQRLEILPGTNEARLMQALLAPLRSVREKDRGEAASIAIAAGDPQLVFVTGDTEGAVWALNELFDSGERVMRVPVFIRTLFERGALSAVAVKGVAVRAAGHGKIPTWWNDWLASI